MNPELRQKIHASKLIDGREKWSLLKYLRNQEISVEQEQNLLAVFGRENEILAEAEQEAEAQNQAALKKWHDQLVEIEHTILPREIAEREAAEAQIEEQKADEILNEIENEF